MKRTIIKIDEEKCNGCGLCVSGCHEGAIQMIDNKARLVSELFCDGLGACIGECPEGAISVEEREAAPYNETLVMNEIIKKGRDTVKAHLKHLSDHGESEFLKQGLECLKEKNLFPELHNEFAVNNNTILAHASCPGSAMQHFNVQNTENIKIIEGEVPSQLTHWPVQLHLLSPVASYFRNADVVLAADCVAFSYGNFHNQFLKGKSLAIACPKLDSELERYIDKIRLMIDDAAINTLTIIMMEVPCCGGLLHLVKKAQQNAHRKVPVKSVVIGIKGDILKEEWI